MLPNREAFAETGNLLSGKDIGFMQKIKESIIYVKIIQNHVIIYHGINQKKTKNSKKSVCICQKMHTEKIFKKIVEKVLTKNENDVNIDEELSNREK